MNLKLAAVLIVLSLPLAGCGNKGSLVLPPRPAEPMLDAPADAVDDADDEDAESASDAPVIDDPAATPPATPSTDGSTDAPAKATSAPPASDD